MATCNAIKIEAFSQQKRSDVVESDIGRIVSETFKKLRVRMSSEDLAVQYSEEALSRKDWFDTSLVVEGRVFCVGSSRRRSE